VHFASNIHANIVNKVEPNYGTKYFEYSIPKEKITEWKDPELNSNISLPMVNPFIPKNLGLKPISEKVR
jgi:secreted Zn-dependent insulinase-like peptidase